MDRKKLTRNFSFFTTRAKVLLKDKEQTISKLQQAFQKAKLNKDGLATVWEKLQLFFSLIKDYSQGHYTQMPIRSVIAILASLLYFLSPLDFIPDFILGLGFMDDVYILTLVYKQVAKDLALYEAWKKKIIPI